MTTRKNHTDYVEARKFIVEQNKQLRLERTPQQQLEKLDKLFGVRVGAKKERLRLQKIISNGQ